MPFDCFEASDRVGGNWVFGNNNGMSAAYRDLHINTSRDRMQFSDFPMPRSLPGLPAPHADRRVLRRLRRPLRLPRPHPLRDGDRARRAARRRHVAADRPSTARRASYDMLLVANGHHWDPRWPEPAFPGADDFEGIQMHAHDYRDNEFLAGKDVVVLGMGNSAMDIAVESSYVARHDAPRRAPRRLDRAEVPLRQAAGPAHARCPHVPHWLSGARLGGDRPPAHRPARALRPAAARPPLRRRRTRRSRGRILDRISHGAITPRPNIARLGRRLGRSSPTARACTPTSSSTARATRSRFRSSTSGFLAAPDNRIELFRRVFAPGDREPRVRRAAAAARRDHAARRGAGPVDRRVPARRVPPAVAARDGGRHPPRARGACASATSPRKRHTIQVDFDRYLCDLRRERRRGARARGRGRASRCRCPRASARRRVARRVRAA